MDAPTPVPTAALRLVRVAVLARAAAPARRLAARMARRAGRLGRDGRGGATATPSARSPTRSGSASGTSPTPAGSTTCATAGASCASTPGSPSSPSASWRSAWPDRSPPSASSRRSCCGRCRIPSPDRVVTLWERQPSTPGRLDVSPATSSTGANARTSFQTLAGAEPYSRDYSDGERPEVWRMLQRDRGLLRELRPAAAPRAHVRARGVRRRADTGGRHQRQPVAIALRRRPRGGRAARSRSTANRGRSPA